ncbi:SET domain protein [Plasmodium brasilianum]|uniref:SET domain protein, putative n=2 Tax=Plasmodium (Plasmodium) TaxID=418103 RepID=A0A1A8VVF4_PLAMA|nr:SET domain protein, putative [Plasmodium malariae]KAI4839341.1 SET domain protein [Plasmodium brasilianum]SBS83662.1 SET domain protein, putative (SET4) [Plasmodium malariae]SBT87755.1 SET domain protein, putative [Plasmodium malariae]
MSKLSKIFENKNEIGFCSCVIKLQEKAVEENKCNDKKKKKKKFRIWVDYFKDIVKDDLKGLNTPKLLDLKNNIELPRTVLKNKHSDVLLYNPFDFDFGNIKEKKKYISLKNKPNVSFLCKEKKKKLTFDDLVWNSKLKKYVFSQESKYDKNGKNMKDMHIDNCGLFEKRNKSCTGFYNSKEAVSTQGNMQLLQSKQIYLKGGYKRGGLGLKLSVGEYHKGGLSKYVGTQAQTQTEAHEIKCSSAPSSYIMGLQDSKIKENSKFKKENKNYGKEFNRGSMDVTSKVFCNNIDETAENIKKAILSESAKLKNEIMEQKHDNILMIQDEKSCRVKIVANKKIEIGQVIFIEECLLETSILINDLWDTYNILNDDQKKNLDHISQLMNMGKNSGKRKDNKYILRGNSEKINNTYHSMNDDSLYSNIQNDHGRKNSSTHKIFEEEISQNRSFKWDGYQYEERKNTIDLKNNIFINNLMKFEAFTDILKNSFISPSDKSKIMLFKNGSFLNHSCFPNACYSFIEKNKICFLAMRTINMYDEITISITNELYASIEYRKRKLNEVKNFFCTCNRCLQIIDEESNILCSVCKYSYVSRKINQKYVASMKKINEKGVEDTLYECGQLKHETNSGHVNLNDVITNLCDSNDHSNDSSFLCILDCPQKAEHSSDYLADRRNKNTQVRCNANGVWVHSEDRGHVCSSVGRGTATRAACCNKCKDKIRSCAVSQNENYNGEISEDFIRPSEPYQSENENKLVSNSNNSYNNNNNNNGNKSYSINNNSHSNSNNSHSNSNNSHSNSNNSHSNSNNSHSNSYKRELKWVPGMPPAEYSAFLRNQQIDHLQKFMFKDIHKAQKVHNLKCKQGRECYVNHNKKKKTYLTSLLPSYEMNNEKTQPKDIVYSNILCNCLHMQLPIGDTNFERKVSMPTKSKRSNDMIKTDVCLENNGMDKELLKILNFEKSINLDNNLVHLLSIKKEGEKKVGYCKFHNSGEWICDTCNDAIPECAIPLDSENYFIMEYKIVKEKISSNKFYFESIINKIEKTLLYIVAILGEKHWLYAAFNYLVADLCFSYYYNSISNNSNNRNKINSLKKEYLLKSFNSFNIFLYFIQIKCPHSIHTDLVPLVLKFLIICIYTCNYKTYYNFTRSGFLELIKQKYGSWDITYLSLLYSFKICYQEINNTISARRDILLMLAGMAKTNMLQCHV